MKCSSCPRKCNALRTDSENKGGFCGCGLLPRVARAALHFWEEPIISGKNGSGTVFFSGCSLSCIYCQNFGISHEKFGKEISYKRLSEIFKELEAMGAHNINLVTPTHFTDAIKKALDIYRPSIPIVYNSSGYESTETLDSLKDYINIYLMDFKYYDERLAAEYSFAPDYPDTAKKALLCAYAAKGKAVLKDGIMQSGVIVRHLLLPQMTNDAIKIFDFVRENLPDAYFSLMSQYVPMNKAKEHKVLNRKITEREYEKVTGYIIESGFQNCFIQERSSADSSFTPDFDLTGI